VENDPGSSVTHAKKNPEPVWFGIEAPIIAMGRAREEGANPATRDGVIKNGKRIAKHTPIRGK
jgi:hypothetical protein